MYIKNCGYVCIYFLIFLLSISVGFPVQIYASEIHKVESKIYSSQQHSSSDSQKDDKEIVKRQWEREVYVRKRFSANELDKFSKFYCEVWALDRYEFLRANNIITQQGEAIDELKLKSLGFNINQNRILVLEDLKIVAAKKMDSKKLWQRLRKKNVCNQDGYLVGLEDKNIKIVDDVDFSDVQTKIMGMDWELVSDKYRSEVEREFVNFLKDSHRMKEIREEKVSSFLGLFKSTYQDTRLEPVEWRPEINLKVPTTFQEYPYYKQNNQLLSFGSKSTMNELRYDYLRDSPLDLSKLCWTQWNSSDEHPLSLVTTGFQFQTQRISELTEGISYSSLSWLVGHADYHMLSHFDLGLSYLSGLSDQSIGAHVGVMYEWFPFYPVSFRATLDLDWQPRFGSTSVWYINTDELSINLHYNQFEFSVGYRWVLTIDSVPIVEGVFVGGSYYF